MNLHRSCNVEVRYIVKCPESLGLSQFSKPYWRQAAEQKDPNERVFLLEESPQEIIRSVLWVVNHPVIFVTEI